MINKVYTSYYYQIRNMPPNMIPIACTMSLPRWYHKEGEVYKDKRGVYNGIRSYQLKPGPMCSGLCGGPDGCSETPDGCSFLRAYRIQLDSINFSSFVEELESLLQRTGVENPIPVFIFYETPKNPCSERWPFQAWLQEHGWPVEEFFPLA